MVQDLMRGFVAPDWSDELDFSTLKPVPASFVSNRLRQRHGDLVWQVRFHDDWLYLLLLLEFQSTVEPAMAVRVMT
ncbi:MAG: Rpn family recombination-promoting nuclease/putative transposase, partial [Spirochaetaceae bacterium]|nr:Rpn family recombination-promoting nuclease/putative transposase [Spirochaetaceae bacterium]